MDFKDQIAELSSRVEKMLPQIQTGAATKNALVMPFIQIMGYEYQLLHCSFAVWKKYKLVFVTI
ncbi:hypothetical protein [Pedobacter hartonius]|uniref:hypothetical protein n=1 Tax=Pedobacter hartonius TaxID=425514 RepID=UPI000ACC8714|nr:hypothetical protein [Pedobacter hartonius]